MKMNSPLSFKFYSVLMIILTVFISLGGQADNRRLTIGATSSPASPASPVNPSGPICSLPRISGHLLIIPAENMISLSKITNQKYLPSLASSEITSFSSFVNVSKNSRILDLTIENANGPNTEALYDQLKTYVKSGAVAQDAIFHAPSLVLNDPIAKIFDNTSLSKVRSYVRGRKVLNEGTDDETIILEFTASDSIILAAVKKVTPDANCSSTDDDDGVGANVDLSEVTGSRPFSTPVSPMPPINYFFGPRILGSLELTRELETKNVQVGSAYIFDKKPPFVSLQKPLKTFWQFHQGIDFKAAVGTPALAVYDGEVFAAGNMGCGGNTLVVKHQLPQSGKIIFSVYRHLKSYPYVVSENGRSRILNFDEKLKPGARFRLLKAGDHVKQGQYVAQTGASGWPLSFRGGSKRGCIDAPHLHFELRSLNPVDFSEVAKNLNLTKKRTFVATRSVLVNPAEFIQEVDQACYSRKSLELDNARIIERDFHNRLPPMTSGLCSRRSERLFASSTPKVFKLRTKFDIETMFPSTGGRKPELLVKRAKHNFLNATTAGNAIGL